MRMCSLRARAMGQVQANSRASILATSVADDGACAVSAEMLPPYECYYEASTRRLVATAFARDVELFGYVPPTLDTDLTGNCSAYDL